MDITVTNLQSKIPIPQKEIIRIARRVGVTLAVTSTSLSIVFVGTQRMRTLNKKYLKHDFVTDVITFDLAGSAEIVICPQVAFQNAQAHGNSVKREILLYVVHGMLHLAGYDDHSPQDIQRMRNMERELMGRII